MSLLKDEERRHDERWERRAQIAPGYAVGVTELMIAALVDAFYADIRADAELGPIFNSRIEDWDAHLAKLADFWSSVTLMTGRFKGSPMAAHAAIPELSAAHFERWLALWRAACTRICPPQAADLFIAKAENIARSLQLGLEVGARRPPPARALPEGLTQYSRTLSFDETSIPAALLKTHSTKAGVWGRIEVEAGELAYRVTDPRRSPRELVLTPGSPGVVEPQIEHEVEPKGPVRFHVAFYR
jgi:truncated hemoglobin YjbI/tellurite resistance-related uncharacterized protein